MLKKNVLIFQKIIDYTGFLSIGIFCAAYATFTSSFAELHIALPFLDFPIFIGEILLFFWTVLFLLKFKISKVSLQRWHCVVLIYLCWLLIKTVHGYVTFGPLAFRNAALFYYPIVAIFSCSFYRKDMFNRRSISFLLVIIGMIAATAWVNPYCRFVYGALFAVLLLYTRPPWIKYVGLFLLILYFKYNHFLMGNTRSQTMGIIAAVVFLFLFSLWFLLRRVPLRKKFILSCITTAILAVGIFTYADKNALKSLITPRALIARYQYYNNFIIERTDTFVLREAPVNLFNVNERSTFRRAGERMRRDYLMILGRPERRRENPPVTAPKRITPKMVKNFADAVNEGLLQGNDADGIPQKSPNASQEEIRPITMFSISDFRTKKSEDDKIIKKRIIGLCNIIRRNFIQEPMAFPHPEDAIKWLNETILPFQIFRNDMKLDELDEEGKAVLHRIEKKKGGAFASLGLEQLIKLTQETDGQRFKRLILEKRYPRWYYPKRPRSLKVAYTNILFRIFIWRDMLFELLDNKAVLGINMGKPQRSQSLEILRWGMGEWGRDGWITPHNSYFHMIYRAGIIGLIIVAGLFVVLFRLIKEFVRGRSLVGVVLSSVLIYWVTMANFLVFFELPYTAIPFWSFLGATWAYSTDLKE